MGALTVSDAIKTATELGLNKDPIAKKIADIEQTIELKKEEIARLESDLSYIQKTRPEISIKWRDSIKWCLEVDAKNPEYFLKTTSGVYNCIAFKHKVNITASIKSKVGSTLSLMFRQKLVGRYEHSNGLHYYGLVTFFENDLTTLKKQYLKDVDKLME